MSYKSTGLVELAAIALFALAAAAWTAEPRNEGPTDKQQGTVYIYPETPGVTGKFKKFNVLTGETVWEIPDPYPNWGGPLVTDGGLAFYGDLQGNFRAVDRKTGKVLWERRLGSGIIGNPITYKVGGKQYVSVWSGIGGWIGLPVTAGLDLSDKFGTIGATAMTKAAGLDKIPHSGVLYTFGFTGARFGAPAPARAAEERQQLPAPATGAGAWAGGCPDGLPCPVKPGKRTFPDTSSKDKDEVTDRSKDPNLWAAPAGDKKNTRHSRLTDINTTNVNKLQMIWSQSSGTLSGHEGQPLVVDVGGTPMMYMESGWPNIIQALDLSDPDHPKEIWNYTKTTDRDQSAVPRACCDTVNRGMSYADGKLVFGTLDGFIVALDAKTGKEVWVVKHAWPAKGETIIGAPLIADGKVIQSFGGDEFAARGRLDAYDLGTGKKVWEFYSTGTDKDVGLTTASNKKHPEYGTAGKDLGIHAFPGDEWKRGGGVQGGFSYDPELKLVYTSTGNAGLWSPSYRCDQKTQAECSSGKWDNTIFARNVDTGEVVWAYQTTPFDQWDYDGINENMLEDLTVDGKPRKVLTHLDRNGFAYVLDRTDGTLLRAHNYVTVNWAEKIDLKTGRPVKVPAHSPLEVNGDTQKAEHLRSEDVTESEASTSQRIQRTIDNYVRSLDDGFFKYQIPTSIERGETLHAYLIAANDKTKLTAPEIEENSKLGNPATAVKPTKVGPYLAATLILIQGEGLVIQPKSDESQTRLNDQPFEWDWAIRADKRGHDKLRITLFIELPASAGEKGRRIRYKDFDQILDVRVSGIASVEEMASAVWKWAFGGIAEALRTALGAAVLAGVVAFWRRRSRKGKTAWVPPWKRAHLKGR